ncbi:MAG TPA: efflux RND transporter periplasmic adaptor subunit [Chryseosolibacter sp.]
MKKKLKNSMHARTQNPTGWLRSFIAAHSSFRICALSFIVLLSVSMVAAGCRNAKKDVGEEQLIITEDIARSAKSPGEAVLASTRTIRPEFTSHPITLEATGVVTYDTRRISEIAARVGGRLERVYLRYAFQPVIQGQKVAEIYSPELLAAQREFLYLLEKDPGNSSLIAASRNKLLLLGLTESQVDNLIRRKEVQSTFALFSPYSGYVITNDPAPELPAAVPGSTRAGGGMDGMDNNTGGRPSGQGRVVPSASLPREGSYVSPGQSLFKIVNTDALRVELNLPGAYGGALKKGDAVDLIYSEGERETATVDLIQPFFEEGQNFLKVRVMTNRTSDLPVGHLVKAQIRLPAKEGLWLPREAVVDLGTKKVVFIKDREIVKPKAVITGAMTDDRIEIVAGLATGDEVAANAQYLVDSESFIKPVN